MGTSSIMANVTNKIYCWAVGRPSDGTVVLKGSLDKEAYKSKNCEAMISQCLRESGKVKDVMSYTKSDLRIGISPHKSASVFFVVCAEKNYPDDAMRALLAQFQTKVNAVHPDDALETAGADSLSKKSKDVADLMTQFQDPDSASKFTRAMNKINDVKQTVVDNIDATMSRNNALEDVDRDATELVDQSMDFNNNAKHLKDKVWWQNCKMYIIGTLVALVLIGILILVIVGATGGFSSD